MKVATYQSIRAHMPWIATLAISSLFVGCGKESDPKAITVDELKSAGGLSIIDKGNGAITLKWSGSNSESDFDGYNVYGVQSDAASLGLDEGESIQLLGDDGEPDAAAKKTLAKFDYDADKGLGLASKRLMLADTSSTNTSDAQFSALPIHTKSGEDLYLPTCMHDGKGGCITSTKSTVGKTVDDDSSLAVNGDISYSLENLTVGKSYCFVVMSSMDGGKKVSQTSSNLACIVPQYAASFDMNISAATTDVGSVFKVVDWVKACIADGVDKCSAAAATNTIALTKAAETTAGTISGSSHIATAPGPVYIEWSSAQTAYTLNAGQYAGVAHLCYCPEGLSSEIAQTGMAPFSLDSETYDTASSGTAITTPIFNTKGYSIAGQSIPLMQNHAYVVAVPEATTGSTVPTKFYYTRIFVKGDPTKQDTKFAVEVMAPAAPSVNP